MVKDSDVLLRLRIRCDERAPSAVREALARLADVEFVFGDAMLIASELVTNAVRHSGGRPQDEIEVIVGRDSEQLMISVRDPGCSGKTARVAAEDDPGALGGFGLRIVEQLTTQWGHERGDGYRVWAEVPVSEAVG